MSLATRVSIAMGVNLVGNGEFWRLVLANMGIKMTESLEKVMGLKDRKLKENEVRSKLNKNKLKWSERLREK